MWRAILKNTATTKIMQSRVKRFKLRHLLLCLQMVENAKLPAEPITSTPEVLVVILLVIILFSSDVNCFLNFRYLLNKLNSTHFRQRRIFNDVRVGLAYIDAGCSLFVEEASLIWNYENILHPSLLKVS